MVSLDSRQRRRHMEMGSQLKIPAPEPMFTRDALSADRLPFTRDQKSRRQPIEIFG
jgi:hypothetical protein